MNELRLHVPLDMRICPFTHTLPSQSLSMKYKLTVTSTVVFHRTQVYQMQPRNGQNLHSWSPEINHIFPLCLKNNRCRADRINEPHEKNSPIEGEELYMHYHSRTNETKTKTTFCTSLKLEFISGCVQVLSSNADVHH